jgi:hypothetical protein
MLFAEVYGTYYNVLAELVNKAADGKLTQQTMLDIVREKGFDERVLTIPDAVENQTWPLIKADFTTPLDKPTMPLTTLQKRWLKALLNDPRIKLFDPPTKGLDDVEPLFTPDVLVYYDRYNNGDYYEDPAYIRNFRTILQALREGSDLKLTLPAQNDSVRNAVITPYYLEYSEKDDRFRLIAGGKKRRLTFNLSRILECEEVRRTGDPTPLRKPDTASVTFELRDSRNALERVLLHFSHLEKETIQLEEDRYLVTLRYDRQDETEMVIRILSFGPMIKVTEPGYFIDLIRERIAKQKQFASFLP